MRKRIITIGAIFVTLLMISTVTAVPTSNSKPVKDIIDRVEQQREKFDKVSDQLPTGIFEIIWQLILALFNLIMKIIEVVNTVLSIVQLFQALINGIQVLLQMIQDFIALLNDLFSPEVSAF
jgi:hypothetical protein